MSVFYSGHYLLGCRLDNWLRLLGHSGRYIKPAKLPQAALITLFSTLLAPFALAESALYNRRIREMPLTQEPVFVLGFWRSGTTFLQNLLSRDERFGWADPVNVNLMPVSLLLGKALRGAVQSGLKDARPMDNLEYTLELPIEETFGMMTVTDQHLLHLIPFPADYKRYVDCSFLEDLPEKAREKWERQYDFLLHKLSYAKGGRQLLLKSPDNTARLPFLMQHYPDARYINIHRDPYATIRSAVHMLKKQMGLMSLTAIPQGIDELMEDIFIELFRRMYRTLFALQASAPAHRWVEVSYEEFSAQPVAELERIYAELELPDFEAARGAFEAYAASQKDYVKNKLELDERLRKKINASLGFYFEHYGYAMEGN